MAKCHEPNMHCPQCTAAILPMAEPRQYACMVCRKVWRISNPIADAIHELHAGDETTGTQLFESLTTPQPEAKKKAQ